MRAVVLRAGRLQVRETADPVAGPGELLVRPLAAAICASDVHYMDHPNSSDRFVWDEDRDVVMGHEFIGEVVGHGPDCSRDFPLGSRVTSMPLLIRGEKPHVIGHDPDAPGAFGELMVVSEVLARTVPDGVPADAVSLFECVGAHGLLQNIVDSCEFLARIYAAGGWYGNDTVSVTAATHKGATIQFGGGPHPVDWYGTLEAVIQGRLDPRPAIGKLIGLDEVPEALDQVRKAQGPPRIVIHHRP
jgi:threonine dehydrogenase-like Zn-dependent dehydrogenase